MRLSDAIRLGAMWKPQAFEGPDRVGTLQFETKTCALAAAAEAAGDMFLDIFSRVWRERWPIVSTVVTCPSCTDRYGLDGIIAHINDVHQWTRERIADWVETVEQASVVLADDGTTHLDDARSLVTVVVDGGDRASVSSSSCPNSLRGQDLP